MDSLFDWSRVDNFWQDHQDSIVEAMLGIAVILAVFFVAQWVLVRLIRRLMRAIVARAESSRIRDPEMVKRRADTMASTVSWVVEIFLGFMALALVLSEIGLNVTALVAGLGVAGLGLGLGAQTLVKDVINGIFILVEDQFNVGDVVEIAGVVGVVEEVNPRRTVLRDLDGRVHVVPNSAITVATNMTQDFSRINLDVGVAYEEDIDRVIEVINDECKKLAGDFASDVISTPAVLRVNALSSSSVDIKVMGDVRIGTQWALMGELRRRLKRRFDLEGIEIPYPHQTTVLKQDKPSRGSGQSLSEDEQLKRS